MAGFEHSETPGSPERNLYCWRMAGYLPYFKIGKAVRFRKAEVMDALERMKVG